MNEKEDNRDERRVDTGGGACVGGGVNTGEGDFVGRDKVVKGDEVKGDEVKGDKVMGDKVEGDKVGGDKITVGDISGSTGVAIGRGAQARVQQGVSGAELNQLFAPLMEAVSQAPADRREAATQKAQALKQEVGKGSQANDSKVADLIQDLVELAPAAVGAITSIFASPAVGAAVGQVTNFVLKRLKR